MVSQAALLLRVVVGGLLLRVVTFPLRRPRVLLVEQQAPSRLSVWSNYLCDFMSHFAPWDRFEMLGIDHEYLHMPL